MGGILPSLVTPNSAPKMQSPQDLLARPKRENGLHSLANITFDPIGNGSGPHSDKRGGLNRSVQHLLAVYLLESQNPKSSVVVDLIAALPHRALLENTLTSLFV
jgi:hypothetical protein